MGAERGTLLVIATGQTGQRVLVNGGVTLLDETQSTQIGVHIGQYLVKAFASVAEHSANLQLGKALLQAVKTGDRLQVVVAIGRDERSGKDPIGKEPVVDDIETLGLVAEVMLASGLLLLGRR